MGRLVKLVTNVKSLAEHFVHYLSLWDYAFVIYFRLLVVVVGLCYTQLTKIDFLASVFLYSGVYEWFRDFY